MRNSIVLKIALVLTVIGGLNWLLVGAFDFNLVHAILGGIPLLERIVYILVGIAAIASLAFLSDGRNTRTDHTVR